MGELVDRLMTGTPVVVVAEAGVNHNGDVNLAHRLVDLAASAGADVVKFQTFDASLLASGTAPLAPYQADGLAETAPSQKDMLSGVALDSVAWTELAAHARERGIDFMSTPFDLPSADLLERLDVPCFKVPSGELTNLPFLKSLAARGKPLLMSTGAATLAEVATAVEAVRDGPPVILMHCVSAYPAPASVANLQAIVTMRHEFSIPVGWSDHTIGSVTAIASVALGATVIEKHITIDTRLPGPDHGASADPDAFFRYVESIREAESALGDGTKVPAPVELPVRDVARRSWHATRDLHAGHVLRPEDIVALRPAGGVAPTVEIVGRRLAHDVRSGSAVACDDLESA